VAHEYKVQLIDLHSLSEKMIAGFGAEVSKRFFLHLEPGKYDNYPKGLEDDTHFSAYGAFAIAGIVAVEIRHSRNELSKLVKLGDR